MVINVLKNTQSGLIWNNELRNKSGKRKKSKRLKEHFVWNNIVLIFVVYLNDVLNNEQLNRRCI